MIAAIIIAGGRASRFDGADKAMISFSGKPLLEHVIERITPQVDLLAINRATPITGYDLTVVADLDDAKCGPIGGLEAAILWAKSLDSVPDYLLTIPVDTPRLPHDLVEQLLPAAKKNGVAIAVTPSGLQPIISLHKLGSIPPAEIVNFKHKALRDFWAHVGAAHVNFDKEGAFININDINDINRHQK